VNTEPLVDQDLVRENLHAAIENLNEQVERNGRGLNFSMDEPLNRPVITVRNTATGEVVRQIPNEVVIKVAHSIENIKGLLLDQKM
jgi:flagellar protein FlaG